MTVCNVLEEDTQYNYYYIFCLMFVTQGFVEIKTN